MKKYYKLLSNRLLMIYIAYMLLFTVTAYSACIIYKRSDLKRSEQKRIEQLTINFESQLSNIRDVATTLSMSDCIIKYSQSDILNQQDIIQAKSEVSRLGYVENAKTSVSVINFNANHVITVNGTTNLSYFVDFNGLKDSVFLEKIAYLSNIESNAISIFTATDQTKNIPYIVWCSSYVSHAGLKPVVFVSLCNLNNVFDSIHNGSIDTTIEVLTEKDNLYISRDETKNNLFSYTKPNEFNSYKNIASAQIYSNTYGLITCNSLAPKFSYMLYINNFFMLLVLLIIALFFIGNIFVKSNTQFLYRPIEKVLNILPKNLGGAHDEFTAFEKHISSLATQKDIMSEIISENKLQLKEKFILNLLTSTLSSAEIKEGIASYNFTDVKFPVTCFIISYRNYEVLKGIISSDGLNEVRISIHEYFKNIFKDSKGFFKLVDIDQQSIAGIISTENPEKFIQDLKTAILSIELILDIDLVAFVGKSVSSWFEIAESYASAKDTKSKYLIISNKNMVISADTEFNEKHNQTIFFSSSTEDEFISSVMAGDTTLAISHINKIINTNMSNTSLTSEYYSQLVIILYSTITKLLIFINKTEKELFKDESIYLELMNCQDVETLKAKLAYFITAIITSIAGTKKDDAKNETELILSYIHNNYSSDISLFSLADYLNVSQVHASRLFKSYTGETFKDYLSNYRLNKAIELMQANPREKISSIAKQVGYSGEAFTRAFTKKFGMKPSAYIQKL